MSQGIAAQILCYEGTRFIGRIDFYVDHPLPVSYLWHPNGTGDPNQIYLVLAMPVARFEAVEQILRTEKAFGLELWPMGEMFGAATDGYAGVLRSLNEEIVGGGWRPFFLASRARAAELREVPK